MLVSIKIHSRLYLASACFLWCKIVWFVLMSELPPRLLSDFDGTAVEKLNPANPRHWVRNLRKYPLAAMVGYADFLGGVESTGVEIGPVVSRRAERLRRAKTTRSISDLSLSEYFGDPEQVILAGSEKEKGRTVAEQSLLRVIGMLEDSPHKLGKSLLEYTLKNSHVEGHHPILIGVVSHNTSYEKISELRSELRLRPQTDDVIVRGESGSNTGLIAYMGPLEVHVTQLEPYTAEEGQRFGERLLDLSAAAEG
jgi:hypothetical protein